MTFPDPEQNVSFKIKIFLVINLLLYKTSKNKDLITQKSDKGNSVVIVDKQDYIKKMNNILSDENKFTILNLKDDTEF